MHMRLSTLALAGTIGFGLSGVAANAAPVIPNSGAQQISNILEIAGGCRRGYQPNRWGHCTPSRYGYSQYNRYSRGNHGHRYQGHGARSPSDNAANHLNRGELGRMHSGSSMPNRW